MMIETKDDQIADVERASDAVIKTATGEVYDKGESIADKMNKQ